MYIFMYFATKCYRATVKWGLHNDGLSLRYRKKYIKKLSYLRKLRNFTRLFIIFRQNKKESLYTSLDLLPYNFVEVLKLHNV